MHNKIIDYYKKLEFGQKLIINASFIALITGILSISIMANVDNIDDLFLSNVNSNLLDVNLFKSIATIISLIVVCIFTLIL